MRELKPFWKDYLKNLCVGILLGIGVYALNAQGMDNVWGRLSDSCFVPAVLLLGLGGLTYVRNHGAFDTLGYSMSTLFRNHVPGASIGNARDEDFTTWRERKSAKRKSPNAQLLAGVTFLPLAVIFLIVYL